MLILFFTQHDREYIEWKQSALFALLKRCHMLDPLTITGTAMLTEGIKFLYSQVTELLRRRHERKEGVDPSAPVIAPGAEAGTLDGRLQVATVAVDDLEQRVPQLSQLRRDLADYAEGIKNIAADDEKLRETAATARALLEALYGQRLTFEGESSRPATGTALTPQEVEARVGTVAASGAGAVAVGGSIHGQAAAGGGVAIGGNVQGGVNTDDRTRSS